MGKGDIPERFRQRIQEAKDKQLEKLDLCDSFLADDKDKLTEIPPEVFELTHLKTLKLSYNRISELPESLGNLTNLVKLDLSENHLSEMPESLGNLTSLTELDLSRNHLSEMPESLGNLTNLIKLDLSRNQLLELPKSLGNLTNLTELCLWRNQLSELPESLGKLTNLTKLGLSRNYLPELPESLGKLTNLTELSSWRNQISEMPESLGKLTNLIKLNLSENYLSELPESLGNLTNLTELCLSVNHLLELPKSFGKLANLIKLDLSENQLLELPETFGNLTNLAKLYLSRNNLSELPETFVKLTNLTELGLSDNPLVKPPIEVAEQGIKAIRKYFRQLKEEGVDYIYEAKLLIVGEGGVGKTTLAKKIDNPNYKLRKEEQSTEGIDIIEYSFPILDKEQKRRNFKVHIWDFGGQEVYHATHQFFLTKRSLYTLVADTRKEDTDFYYWLNVVELLSDNSPLLIIKNEKQDRKREINQTALQGQFTNLKEVLATNLATNRGLEDIVTNIQNYINNLSHIGDPLPKTWVKVRQALEQDNRHYISLKEYLHICEVNGFTRYEYKLQLSEYLHDLGVCLHFQDEEDALLYKTVILNPTWGTDAVYKVLDNDQVVNNQGHFTRKDLKSIWHEEKYAAKRGELLELMKKFQLCYQIPGNKNSFIAPQLLSDNQPEYDWDESSNLILRYTYPDFMPKGIVTRFIVAMHEHIERQEYVWKSGVILSKDGAKAEVIEYYGKREIKIRVSGNNQRSLMTIIAYELDKIINSYNRLKYNKLIPCNCSNCKNSQSPHSYPFEILQKFITDRQEQIQCQKSYEMVNVLSLIDDVGLKPLIRYEGKDINRDNQESSDISISNVETVILQTGEGQIKMDDKQSKETRNINTGGGNYNENIEGDYIQQQGNENTVQHSVNVNREISREEQPRNIEENRTPRVSPVERGIALAMALGVLATFMVLVLNPREMDSGTLAIVRFLAASFAGIAGYLFSGNLGLEAKMPLNKTTIRAAGGFAAFVLVLFAFFVGVPESSN